MSDQKKDPTNVDLDDFLDLDFSKESNKVQQDDGASIAAQTSKTTDKNLSSKEELELEFANSKAKASPAPTLDFETTANDEPEPVVATTKKPKIGLFGKKDKAPKAVDTKTDKPKGGLFGSKVSKEAKKGTNANLGETTPKTKTAKKPTPLIIGGVVVALIVLVGLLFALLGGDDTPVEPIAPPVASAPPSPPAETLPAPEVPPAPTDTPTSTSTESSMIPTNTPDINPDEILTAEIPADPALLKEEIDRLADTEKQLDEQSKMIKEQLDLMNDLTKAKDEEIALLEAQIAELEKQRAGK